MSQPEPFEQLPILAELHEDLRARLAATAASGAERPAPARARLAPRVEQPARLRSGRRVARRAAIAAAIALLVGTTAVAERTLVGGDDEPTTSPTQLAAGGPADERWRLAAYRNDGDVCFGFLVAGNPASECGPALDAGEVRPTSVSGPSRRYVVGLAGSAVDRVAIIAGGRRLAVAARPAPDPGAAEQARLAGGVRWFVVTLRESSALNSRPTRVVAQGRDGRAIGPAVLDCSLDQTSAACERLRHRRADP